MARLYRVIVRVSDPAAACESSRSAGTRFAEGSRPGVGPLGEIARRPWGEESSYVSDPFGNRLCFVSRDSAFTG